MTRTLRQSSFETDTPNRVLYSDDCLNVLNDELAMPTGSVDLIYLDPPFNSKSVYNLPFKGKDKDARPVAAFDDTWTWGAQEDDLLRDLNSGPRTRYLADVITLAQHLGATGAMGRGADASLAPYLVNMATRLLAMRRVLSDTGSIYLHCDPTASHYLKLLMDAIWGQGNFRNEVVWHYRRWPAKQRNFQRMHDVILFYSRRPSANVFKVLMNPLSEGTRKRWRGKKSHVAFADDGTRLVTQMTDEDSRGAPMDDVWDIPVINSQAKERVGYPTQKPLALLERIISASSNEGDFVLDPFCGCGTAVHAAESLGRQWMGIDVSTFAVGLIRGRILRSFELLTADDVLLRGVPATVVEAEALAERDKFEFEKWVCGAIGAEGMFHEPGTRGADGGVDGVLKFYPFRIGQSQRPSLLSSKSKAATLLPTQ